ncbi:hypothetical protein MPC1_370006 [Methylocella tundrae]|nr:hypothetical protein MPC1_370006 [Methylocella tundrae]
MGASQYILFYIFYYCIFDTLPNTLFCVCLEHPRCFIARILGVRPSPTLHVFHLLSAKGAFRATPAIEMRKRPTRVLAGSVHSVMMAVTLYDSLERPC